MASVHAIPGPLLRRWSLAAFAAAGRPSVKPQSSLLTGVQRHRALVEQQRRSFAVSCSVSSTTARETTPVQQQQQVGVKRNVVEVLEERGLVESVTSLEELRQSCMKQRLKVYCGFDPTAESLHLGNLLGIIVLSWFQRCGHIPVALLGGATGRVGDPSGKSKERPVLDEDTISRNSKGIGEILSKILQTEGDEKAIVVNNYDWWKEFSLLDFLRDVGKYARVGTMMAKESVKTRLNSEEGMSYTEFTYQLLQGYDFVHLFKEEGVSVQIGGSDQWGNITAGTDLVRRLLQQEGAYGLTFPLLLKSDGSKFGKSESEAIWLAPSALSPYNFYQHLFATPDSDVIKFMKRLTFVEMKEIEALEASMRQPGYIPNSVQKRLAEEVTRFVHGEQGLAEALKATQALAPGAAAELDSQALEAIAQDVPSCSVSYSSVVGASLVDVAVSTGLLQSKAAARRLIKQGGLYLNNKKVEDEAKAMAAEDIIDETIFLLSAGKKNRLVVRVTRFEIREELDLVGKCYFTHVGGNATILYAFLTPHRPWSDAELFDNEAGITPPL